MRHKVDPNLPGFEAFYPPPGSWSRLLELLEDDVDNGEVAEWVWWFLGMEDWRIARRDIENAMNSQSRR